MVAAMDDRSFVKKIQDIKLHNHGCLLDFLIPLDVSVMGIPLLWGKCQRVQLGMVNNKSWTYVHLLCSDIYRITFSLHTWSVNHHIYILGLKVEFKCSSHHPLLIKSAYSDPLKSCLKNLDRFSSLRKMCFQGSNRLVRYQDIRSILDNTMATMNMQAT